MLYYLKNILMIAVQYNYKTHHFLFFLHHIMIICMQAILYVLMYIDV